MSKEGKARIIDAARRVISRNGIFGATVRGIAEEANMSTGGIYHYYKNKEELLYDVMDESLSMSTKISRQAAEGIEDLEKLYEDISENIYMRFQKYDDNRLQFYLSHDAMLGDEELKAKFKEKYNIWITGLESLMGNLYEKPSGRLSNAFASILFGSLDGTVLQVLLEANTAPVEDLVEVYNLIMREGIPRFLDLLKNIE